MSDFGFQKVEGTGCVVIRGLSNTCISGLNSEALAPALKTATLHSASSEWPEHERPTLKP